MVRAAVMVATLWAACCGAAAGRARLAVTGFQVAGDPPALIDASAPALTTVGIDGVELARNGHAVADPDAAARTELAHAHADHLRGELVVSNFDERIQDFSELIAHRLLGSGHAIARVAGALAGVVRREGWDGVCVDLESLEPRDAAGLVGLVRRLRHALGGRSLSVAISNETSAAAFAGDGYRLRAVGRVAGRVILMGYDEHGPWERTPGPIGALGWQQAGLRVLLRAVPAAKVDLGVAGYGYAWRRRGVIQLTDAQARALAAAAGVGPRFDPVAGEWTATLPDGTVAWWSDGRSYAERVAIAARLRLHGLAVWSLGQSDPLPVAP